jgi:hypothetical protein
MVNIACSTCLVNESNMSMIPNIKPEMTDSVLHAHIHIDGYNIRNILVRFYAGSLCYTPISEPITSAGSDRDIDSNNWRFCCGASTMKLFYDWSKELALKFDGTTSRTFVIQ